MPVRLTPEKSLLITYDEKDSTWVTLHGMPLCVLSQHVDIEPGVTLEVIFNLIDQNLDVKRLLAEYCSVDFETVRQAPPTANCMKVPGDEVVEDERGILVPAEYNDPDQLVIYPFSWVYTDQDTQQRTVVMHHDVMARSSRNEDSAISLGSHRHYAYTQIKHLEVRLKTELTIDECDEDKLESESEDTFAFIAHKQFTLFEVLTTICDFFGTPVFDSRYQKQVDEDEEFDRKLRERWKKEKDGDSEEQ